jgi:hypothetical protein
VVVCIHVAMLCRYARKALYRAATVRHKLGNNAAAIFFLYQV